MLSLIAGPKGQVYAFVPELGCNPLTSGCASATITSDQLGFSPSLRPQETLIGDNTFNGIDEARSLEDVKAFGRNTRTIWNVGGQFSLPSQADVVFSFGQWHKLRTWDYGFPMPQFLKLLSAGMKPGGTLVIADYAAKPGVGFKDNELMRRTDKEAVKKELTDAGFTFVAESAILAKPDDPHTRRVRDDDVKPRPDNDMFLLKFQKPANAAKDNRPTAQQYAGWMNTSYIHADTKPDTAGGIWINADGSYNQQGVSMGSWFFDASGNFCMQAEAPAPARDFVGCYPWAPHKVGDVFTQDTNAKPAQRTLRNVFYFKPQPPPPPKMPYTGEGDAAQ
jgi:predicted methyltransferase